MWSEDVSLLTGSSLVTGIPEAPLSRLQRG